MNYRSLDPTLKWSEMTKHLRTDDANPSDDANPQTTYGITKCSHKLNIVSTIDIYKYIVET